MRGERFGRAITVKSLSLGFWFEIGFHPLIRCAV